VLEAPLDVAGEVRAKILFQAAWTAATAGDRARCAQFMAESLELYRTLVQRSPEEPTLQRGLIAAYNQAEEIAVDQVAWVPLFQPKNIYVFQNYVKGFTIDAQGRSLDNIWPNVKLLSH
jgi:ABC-type oligopeptide transport system substrate-binding subunit